MCTQVDSWVSWERRSQSLPLAWDADSQAAPSQALPPRWELPRAGWLGKAGKAQGGRLSQWDEQNT